MYLKVLCNLGGPDIDKRILQEPLEFQFFHNLLQFSNGDIRPLYVYGIPRKVKRKKPSARSQTSLLQDDGDNNNSKSVPIKPIIKQRLGFDENEDSDTVTRTGVYVGVSTSASKYAYKYGTCRLE